MVSFTFLPRQYTHHIKNHKVSSFYCEREEGKCMLVLHTLPCLFVHMSLIICLFHVSIFKTKAEDIHGRGRGLGPARVGIVFFILL